MSLFFVSTRAAGIEPGDHGEEGSRDAGLHRHVGEGGGPDARCVAAIIQGARNYADGVVEVRQV